VGIAVVYCLGTGTWTSYGGKASETAAINSVKLDMVYDPLLLAGFSVAVDQFIRHEERRTQWRGRWGSIAGILVVGLLLFTRQGRRQMVAALLIAGLQVIFNPILWARIRRSTLRLGALGVVALAFGAIVNFGSLAWRKSSAEFQTNSMAERLGDTMHRVNMIDAHDMSTVRERFTYLWLDAATIQYDSLVGGTLLLTDMFRDSVVAAIPKVLFPDKVEYGLVECEQAFERIDVWADLPCTPSAEGFLTNGLTGVGLVAMGFGLIAGLASYLTRRRTVFCLAAGAELVQGLTLIECSAFPWTFAVRSAVFSTVCVVLISWVLSQLPSPVSNRGRTRPAAA